MFGLFYFRAGVKRGSTNRMQEFLTETSKRAIPLADLTSLAADRRAFGDDVIAAFTSQIQQRSTAAQGVLDAATAANRDSLLASEQRSYDSSVRERDSILSLLHSVEWRTEARGHVPASQTTIDHQPDRDHGPESGAHERDPLHRLAAEARRRAVCRRARRAAVRQRRAGVGARQQARTVRPGAGALPAKIPTARAVFWCRTCSARGSSTACATEW